MTTRKGPKRKCSLADTILILRFERYRGPLVVFVKLIAMLKFAKR